MKYFLSGNKGSPALSLLSKCVPKTHLGKIFSITQAISTVIGMAMSFASTQVIYSRGVSWSVEPIIFSCITTPSPLTSWGPLTV